MRANQCVVGRFGGLTLDSLVKTTGKTIVVHGDLQNLTKGGDDVQRLFLLDLFLLDLNVGWDLFVLKITAWHKIVEWWCGIVHTYNKGTDQTVQDIGKRGDCVIVTTLLLPHPRRLFSLRYDHLLKQGGYTHALVREVSYTYWLSQSRGLRPRCAIPEE